MSAAAKSATAFWDSASGDDGLRFWSGWLNESDAAAALEEVLDSSFPWDEKPRLFGTSLPQHAYVHDRANAAARGAAAGTGLAALERLCERVERDLGAKVSTVYCNRFADPEHHIQWHQDQYGAHIAVLTLGASRAIEYEVLKTRERTSYCPRAGDLYFMSLGHNASHRHRVCAANAADEAQCGTRVSFVFFVTPPFGLPQYRISWREQLRGAFHGSLSMA